MTVHRKYYGQYMTYINSAKKRGRRRKSTWNLILLPITISLVGAFYWSFFIINELLHTFIYAEESFEIDDSHTIGPILASIAPLFAALPLGMLLGNLVVRQIPPARRALDAEAHGHPATGYTQSQRAIFKLAVILVPVSFGVAMLGILMPWV